MEQLGEYRERMLAAFERQPAEFAQVIAAMPEAEWWLRRAPDGRSVHAVMSHVRDLETLAYLPRLRRIVAEDNPALQAFHNHRWSEVDYDPTEPMEVLLEAYANAREEELALVRGRPDEVWSRRGFHPPTGWRTVQWWVETGLKHGLTHLAELKLAAP